MCPCRWEWHLFTEISLVVPGKRYHVEDRTKRALLPYTLGPIKILNDCFMLSLMLAAST